jgi:predicted ATP-dependent serine protease
MGGMAKPKRRYVCQACGSVTHRWQGQCADCSEWNTLAEEAPETVFQPNTIYPAAVGGWRLFRSTHQLRCHSGAKQGSLNLIAL